MSEERFGSIERTVQKLEGNVHKLTILHEETRDWVGRIADGLAALNEKMDRGFARLDEKIERLGAMMRLFIDTQTRINRELSDRGANHDKRIAALEKRRKGIP